MNIQKAANLAAVGQSRASTSEDTSPEFIGIIDRFLVLRLAARRLHARLESIGLESVGARRESKRLELASPFNGHRIGLLQIQIEALDQERSAVAEDLRDLGRMVINLAPDIDASTTFDQRLELLNCNVADHPSASEEYGLVNLVAALCVEDSAMHRRDEWNDRPLHAAVNAEIMRVMFETPEGRAASSEVWDAALAPGGVFHGVPTYHKQADGTMLRKGPALVLHDAAGSRVIERSPS